MSRIGGTLSIRWGAGTHQTEPRFATDEVRLRSYQSNIGKRYVIEARGGGRVLGDRDYVDYNDALAFAEMEAKWHGARLVNEVAAKRG